jgi:hypothetical protein
VADKTWIVSFKRAELKTQLVVASSAGILGDHLVFLNSRGELTALFLLDVVEGWDEIPNLG